MLILLQWWAHLLWSLFLAMIRIYWVIMGWGGGWDWGRGETILLAHEKKGSKILKKYFLVIFQGRSNPYACRQSPPNNSFDCDVVGHPDGSGKEDVHWDPEVSSLNANWRSTTGFAVLLLLWRSMSTVPGECDEATKVWRGGKEGLEGSVNKESPPLPNLLHPPSKRSEGDSMMQRGQTEGQGLRR